MICEASQRPTMPLCTGEERSISGCGGFFWARDLLVRRRTQIINALRGHLAEFGLVIAKGPAHVGRLTLRRLLISGASTVVRWAARKGAA